MTFQSSDPNDTSGEIALSESQLQRAGMIILCLVLLLSVVGFFVSPRDGVGKPILLSPEVKAVEDYRRSAKSWMGQLRALDSEIAGLLQTDREGDLFTQSRQAQHMLEHAVDLARHVDQAQKPAAALGYHEQMHDATIAYLEAARAGMRWVSAPEQTRKDEAQTKLDQSRAVRKTLENNAWMATP